MGTMAMKLKATLTDGTVFDVVAKTPDLMRYEMYANRQGWPAMKDAPMLSAAFGAWSAAKRDRLTDLKWQEFSDQLDDLDIEGEDVLPTETAPEAD